MTPAGGWSSRRSCRPRACCARSGAGSTPTAWAWTVREPPASTCSCRRTSPAGTTRAGWTRRRSARAGRWPVHLRARRGSTRTSTPRPGRPGGARRRGRRVLGRARDLRRRCAPASSATPPTRSATADASWKKTRYPVLALNALRMLVATSPDYLTSMSSSDLLHRARPRLRGPARDRGRHARARRHRPVAPLVPAALAPGSALAVYGAGKLAQLPRVRDGRRAGAGAPGRRHRAAERLPRRRRRLRCPCWRRSATRPTAGCARSSRLRRRARVRRGRAACAGTRRPRALADLHAEGKVSVLPAVGYTERRPVALHLAPLLGGRRAGPAPAHGLARAGCWTASARRTTRCRACRSDGQLAPDARHGAQPGRGDRQAGGRPASGRPARGAPAEDLAVPAFTQHRPRAAGLARPRRRAGRARRRVRRRRARRARAAGRGRQAAPTRPPPPTRRPPTRSRSGSPASPRCSPPGLPIRAASIARPGAYDTHANQAESLPKNLQAHVRLAARLPARPRGARARRPRARCWCGRSSGAARPENGSGTDHGAAGVGFLIGTRAAGRMVGEFPGLAKLDEDGNLRATVGLPRRLRRAVRRLVRRRPGGGPAGRARHRQAGDPQVKRARRLPASALAAPAQAAAPSRVLVEATEFRFTLSRTTVKPGPAIVQLAIRGEDPHDLRLAPLGGRASRSRRAVPETLPGARRRVARQAHAAAAGALLLAPGPQGRRDARPR